MERNMDRKKIEELMEENMTLEIAQKESMDESLHLGWELKQISRTSELAEAPQKSMGHEVNELTSKSTLKKSLEMKEEKIAALEARLEESTNYNQQLRQELKTVKKNYEALKQRQDEARMVQTSPPTSGEDNKWEQEDQETTRELLKVQSRVIEVERNVENATLNSRTTTLMNQNAQLLIQQSSLENGSESVLKEREDLKSLYNYLIKDQE
ncbi:Girdin [Manis javanica]|nr:Girdin [Manis javanica]